MTHSYRPYDKEWFGYSKEQVMLSLLRYKHENQKKIDDIKLEIEQIQLENDHLKKQCHLLKQQTKTCSEDQALYEYALHASPEAVQVMHRNAEQKMRETQKLKIAAANSFNEELEKLSHRIQRNIQMLQPLQNASLRRKEVPQTVVVPQKTATPEPGTQPAEIAQKQAAANNDSPMETETQDTHPIPVKDDFWEMEPDVRLTETPSLEPDAEKQEDHFASIPTTDAPKDPLAMKDSALYYKSQFLIGKFVGEDLIDENGKVIAKRNTVITEDIIIEAEQSEKLADLVINMSASRISA